MASRRPWQAVGASAGDHRKSNRELVQSARRNPKSRDEEPSQEPGCGPALEIEIQEEKKKGGQFFRRILE